MLLDLFRIRGIGLLLFCCACSSMAYAEPEVKLDANQSKPYWSKDMKGQGMCGEIVHAISKAAGIKSVLAFKPLKRMIEDDSNNDLGNPAFYMDNQEFAAIVPIAVIHTAIFSYRPNHTKPVTIHSLQDLRGYKLGALKGTVVDRSSFADAGIVFEESYSQESLFKKLRKGRIDLVVEIDLVGRSVIEDIFPGESDAFTVARLPESESPIAILLADDQPDGRALGMLYRQGLQQIRDSGEYTAILKRYYDKGILPDQFDATLDRFSYLYLTGDE